MPQAVIFDVDGTLVDSNDLHASCWVDTFREFGLDVPFDRVRGQIGKGGDQLLPAVLDPSVIEEHGEAMEDLRSELFMRDYLERVQPFPGVKPLFEKIRSDGLLIVLASSGRKAEVDHHIELLDIGKLIEAATTSDDAESSKPEPDIFEAALKRIPTVSAAEAIVVGDTPYDVIAAGKAGLQTIGLLCGGFPERDLRDAGCIAIFGSPEQLLERYELSPLRK